ncbi:hypothetical protein K435DRAFT_963670 [Dendrothele bispora CBS 962.96]|uniref:Uncharacterized protein n=1 Tax=Dendrothele bispora (strain CBS 962.96) TaxID=1314807 RepID=A0A4S8MG73_DENBC|nr:hypothetical protein K435DRAFT_963670 [Dendrothele bispora CBS 962.96]
MPPFHFHHFYSNVYRRPRAGRSLLWFIVGAGAATWYHKHRDIERARYWGHGPQAFNREYGPGPGRQESLGRSGNVNAGPVEASWSVEVTSEPRGWSWPSNSSWEGRSWGWGPSGPGGPPQAGDTATNSPVTPPPDQDPSVLVRERERIIDMSRHIGNTVNDLSESTLETLMDSAAALKAKLAEQRRHQEQLELQLKKEEEYRRMNPPRHV